jgi:hypothetical protein
VRIVSSWIIDDDGEILHFHSQRLRTKLRVRFLQQQDHVPLLRNLGFIGIRETPHGASISFRPSTVGPVAVASLSYWLNDTAPSRFLLTVLEKGHCVELHASLADCLGRINQLIDDFRRDDLFRQRDVSPDSIPASLAEVFSAWKVSGGTSDFASLRSLLGREPAGQYLLVRPDHEGGRFIIEQTGSGLRIPDPAWAKAQIGRSIADAPDKAYGQWVTEAYKSVLVRDRPQLDHIEAKIYWPRLGRLHHRYDRLLLPVRDRGRPMLLSINNSSGGVRGDIEAA